MTGFTIFPPISHAWPRFCTALASYSRVKLFEGVPYFLGWAGISSSPRFAAVREKQNILIVGIIYTKLYKNPTTPCQWESRPFRLQATIIETITITPTPSCCWDGQLLLRRAVPSQVVSKALWATLPAQTVHICHVGLLNCSCIQ